jgi:hypothetical protein
VIFWFGINQDFAFIMPFLIFLMAVVVLRTGGRVIAIGLNIITLFEKEVRICWV